MQNSSQYTRLLYPELDDVNDKCDTQVKFCHDKNPTVNPIFRNNIFYLGYILYDAVTYNNYFQLMLRKVESSLKKIIQLFDIIIIILYILKPEGYH